MLTLDANVWIAVYDPRDRFHAQSAALLSELARRRVRLYGPAFVVVESACALARRAQDPSAGELAQSRLRTHPLLTLSPLDEVLLATAAMLGTRHLLRGADALYAATALLRGTPLISWDEELIRRAGAVTPAAWLTANP